MSYEDQQLHSFVERTIKEAVAAVASSHTRPDPSCRLAMRDMMEAFAATLKPEFKHINDNLEELGSDMQSLLNDHSDHDRLISALDVRTETLEKRLGDMPSWDKIGPKIEEVESFYAKIRWTVRFVWAGVLLVLTQLILDLYSAARGFFMR